MQIPDSPKFVVSRYDVVRREVTVTAENQAIAINVASRMFDAAAEDMQLFIDESARPAGSTLHIGEPEVRKLRR